MAIKFFQSAVEIETVLSSLTKIKASERQKFLPQPVFRREIDFAAGVNYQKWTSEAVPSRISVENIRPFPKARPRMLNNTNCIRKSAILSDTPEKDETEQRKFEGQTKN